MRPKETYTKDEYNQLMKKKLDLEIENRYLRDELEREKNYRSLTQKIIGDGRYNDLQRVLKEIDNRQEKNELYIKYPYYKELIGYVDMGISDVKQLAYMTGKSKATIYRALARIGITLNKPDVSSVRLNGLSR